MVLGDNKSFWKIFRYFIKSRDVFLKLSTVDVVVSNNKRTIVLLINNMFIYTIMTLLIIYFMVNIVYNIAVQKKVSLTSAKKVSLTSTRMYQHIGHVILMFGDTYIDNCMLLLPRHNISYNQKPEFTFQEQKDKISITLRNHNLLFKKTKTQYQPHSETTNYFLRCVLCPWSRLIYFVDILQNAHTRLASECCKTLFYNVATKAVKC